MSFMSGLSDKLYDSQQYGWLGHKVNDILGPEFQHHLTDFTVTGEPFQAQHMGYARARANGDSGWATVNRNSEKVAAILAAIYGGAAALGGSAASGSGAAAGSGGAAAGESGGMGSLGLSGAGSTAETSSLMGEGFGSAGGGSVAGYTPASTSALGSAGMADYGAMGSGSSPAASQGVNYQKLIQQAMKNQSQQSQQQRPQVVQDSMTFDNPYPQQPSMGGGEYSPVQAQANSVPYAAYNPYTSPYSKGLYGIGGAYGNGVG